MTRVLVVDDESQNRYLLEVLLAGEGLEVESASNGREALAAVRRRVPDLVISDILMPEMDGFLLCRAMKGTRRSGTCPSSSTPRPTPRPRTSGSPSRRRGPLPPQADGAGRPARRDPAAPRGKGARERRRADGGLAEEVAFLARHDKALARKLEKKHHELQESEARYRSYFRSSPVAILVTDDAGRLLDANPAASLLSGYDPVELLGANVSILLGEGGGDTPLRLAAGRRRPPPARPSGAFGGRTARPATSPSRRSGWRTDASWRSARTTRSGSARRTRC